MANYKPSKDLRDFIKTIEDKKYSQEYVFVILGKNGPTGKTYLTDAIKRNGYNAVEITEDVLGLVDYNPGDNENYYKIDEFRKVVIVVLNKPLIRRIDILC